MKDEMSETFSFFVTEKCNKLCQKKSSCNVNAFIFHTQTKKTETM